jgi:hypothetical protein
MYFDGVIVGELELKSEGSKFVALIVAPAQKTKSKDRVDQ